MTTGGGGYGPADFILHRASENKLGSTIGIGYRQVDFSAFKEFHITEAQAVGFRADFFNVFNIASYDNPENNITDGNFGQITNVRSAPRQIQFSAQYRF